MTKRVGTVEPTETEQETSAARLGIGRAALLIGGLTVVARILGFGRTLVFAGTVKTSCLAAAYVTANQVPNVIYDIVLGGALTAIVVPVLAGPADRAIGAGGSDASRDVRAISSALLTWTVVILTPVSLAVALASGPVISALMPANPESGCARAQLVAIAGRMLVVFAPQIVLYGVAVVLYGILQSHRRFTAPALAPIVSSVGRVHVVGRNDAGGGRARADRRVARVATAVAPAADVATARRGGQAGSEPRRGRRGRADRAGCFRAVRHQAGQ